MRLQYEIATTGQDQLRSVLRGVEREAMASDKRLATSRRASAREVAREQGGAMHGPGRKEQMAAIRQTERAQAMSTARQMRQQAAARRVEERAALAGIKKQERAKIDAERGAARARDSLDRQRARGLLAQHNAEQRSARRLGAGQRSMASRIGGGMAQSLKGSMGGLALAGGAAMGIAGGFAAADAMREQSAIQREASMLANQAGTPGAKGALARESTSVRGLSGTEALKGMGEFVTKTGDLDTARQMKGSMGDLSLATGAEFGDLMATAGQAFNVLKDQISDPVERLNELNKLMGVLAQQGAMGAVEIKDLAQDFGKLGAATRGFEGSAPDLLRTMGAFAQIAVARGGAESSADASTASSRLVGDIVTHKKKFAGLGVDVKSKVDKTKLRDPMEIIADVLEKTGGDVMKTSGLFGLESGKIFKGFAATFSEAEKKERGSGRKAVMGEFKKFQGAELDPAAVKERAESRMSDPDMQMKEAAKTFNTAIGRELAPVAMQLARQFAELVPLIGTAARMFAKFVGFMLENPFQGIGLIVGAALVKDIASAGVGALLKGALSKAAEALSKRGGGSIDAETGEFKAGGKLAAAGMGAALGITVATAIITAGVANFEKSEADMSAEGQRLNEVRASTDPEEIRKQVREQRKRVDKLRAPGIPVLGAVSDFVTGADETKKTELNTAESNLAEMEARMAAAEKAQAAADAQLAAAKATSEAAVALKASAGKSPNRSMPIVALPPS